MSDTTKPLVAADGTPLKRKLAQSLMRSRARAFGLALPLLAFILVLFVYPIANFLTQAFYDARFATLMPGTTEVLKDWDAVSAPTEEMATVLVADLIVSKKEKTIGKVATRVLIVRLSGTRSLFTKTARSAKKMEAPYMEALIKKDKDWGDIEVWQAMKTASRVYTPAYLAGAVDLKMLADGSIVRQDEDRRIHVILFWRTLEISFLVTLVLFHIGLSRRLHAIDAACAYLKPVAYSGVAAILDVPIGADYCMDRDVTGAGCVKRFVRGLWFGGRR